MVFTFLVFLPNPAIVHARNESVRTLALAADAVEMERAVGNLGIVFHLANGSWIAVCYVDRHHGDFWSNAVALDSAGRWYESEKHFCGTFKIYGHQWAQTLEFLQNPKATKEEKKSWLADIPLMPAPLCELEESADLAAAQDCLLKLGFRQSDQHIVAKMRGPWPEKIETKAAVARRFLQ